MCSSVEKVQLAQAKGQKYLIASISLGTITVIACVIIGGSLIAPLKDNLGAFVNGLFYLHPPLFSGSAVSLVPCCASVAGEVCLDLVQSGAVQHSAAVRGRGETPQDKLDGAELREGESPAFVLRHRVCSNNGTTTSTHDSTSDTQGTMGPGTSESSPKQNEVSTLLPCHSNTANTFILINVH